MVINLACCTMVCWGLFVQMHIRVAKKPLPPIPSIGLTTVPGALGYQFVRVEMFAASLMWAEAKSGVDSELAVTYRAELADARARIDRLQRVIDASGDDALRAEADRRIAQCLREYREGLTMTPMERYERVKRMQEKFAFGIALSAWTHWVGLVRTIWEFYFE